MTKKTTAPTLKRVWLYAGGGVLFVAVLGLIWIVGFRRGHAAVAPPPAGDAPTRAAEEPTQAGDAPTLDDIAGLYVNEKDSSQIDVWADAYISWMDKPSGMKPLGGGVPFKFQVEGDTIRVSLPRLGDITVKDSVLVSSTRGRYVRKRRWGEQSPGEPVGAARPGQARPASHQPDEWPVSIAVSRDGSTAVASYREGTIWVWDPKTGRSIGAWENNFRANVALSSDGKCLGLDAWGGTVHRMMNPRTGQFLGASLQSPNMYTNRAFSPDGSLYYAQAAQHGYILDGVTGVEQRHIEVNLGEQLMYSFPFELLPDGVTCLSLANDVITLDLWGTRFELQWWNLQTGSLDRKLLLSKSGALYPQMAVSRDGKMVALRVIDQPGRRQPFIELRSAASGEVIGSLQDNSYDRNQQAEHLAFTNEDKTLTILNRSVRRAGEILACRIEEWDIATRRMLRSQQIKLARIPNDTAIPIVSGAANRLIYPAPIGLTFVDLTTCKSVQPGPAEAKR